MRREDRYRREKGLVAAEAPVAVAPPATLGDLLPKLLPELTLATAALAWALFPDRLGPMVRDSLTLVVFVEVIFCLGQGTLTDIATRLRKPPPLWLVPLIVGAVVMVSPEIVGMVRVAWAEGWPVFLPFAWSLLERLRELWTMPRATPLEKMRRRALVGDRIALVLVFGGLVTLTAVAIAVATPDHEGFAWVNAHAAWILAAAFGLAAWDVVRVHRAAFARRPRALFGKLDPLGIEDLSTL